MSFHLNCGSALFAIIAAILWFYSAFGTNVYLPNIPPTARSDQMIMTKNGRPYNLTESLFNQSKWSGYAAIAAGAAAALQALALILKD